MILSLWGFVKQVVLPLILDTNYNSLKLPQISKARAHTTRKAPWEQGEAVYREFSSISVS